MNTTTLPEDINESLTDFDQEWKQRAKEIRSSYQWNEMNIYTTKKAPPDDQRTTIYKVLTPGEAQEVPVGTSDVSKVEIKARSSD